MDRLDAMMLFVSAVDEGALAAAARRHGRSPAAVTRAVAFLERSAGETLMLRSTRRLSLTPAGERHVAAWRDILARLRDLEQSGEGLLAGSVTLTAPELFGQLHVLPVVETFLREHQQVSARLLLANRLMNLVGEGVDIAVRLAPLPDSTFKGDQGRGGRRGSVRRARLSGPQRCADPAGRS